MPVLIAFTKFDPDLVNDENLNASRIKLIDKIEKMCDDFEVGYVNSSIYERNSIENLLPFLVCSFCTSQILNNDPFNGIITFSLITLNYILTLFIIILQKLYLMQYL